MKEDYTIIKYSKLRKEMLEDSILKYSRGDIVFTENSIGIVLNNKKLIEQNKKKKVKQINKIKPQIYAVWHKKNITPFQQSKIVYEAKKLLKKKGTHLLACYKYALEETFKINQLDSISADRVETYLLKHQKEWKFFQ